jgi:serine acetyltransferase
MPETTSTSQAKRILLGKHLRGDTALRTVQPQQQQMRPQEDVPNTGAAEKDATQKSQATMPTSSGDGAPSAKPGVAVDTNTIRKSLIRKAVNRILHLACRFGPGGLTLRPFLHRLRGVRIGKNVWIGDDVYLDNEFPECIELHDGAMIELRATVIAHTHGAGKVVIGKNSFVGAGSMIVAAANRTIIIGEGAVVVASSLVNSSIAPYTLYGSDSARPLAKITKPFTATTSYAEFIATLRPL